jgi:hypothetical protein
MGSATKMHISNNLDLMRLVFAIFVLVSHAAELVDGNRGGSHLLSYFIPCLLDNLAWTVLYSKWLHDHQ